MSQNPPLAGLAQIDATSRQVDGTDTGPASSGPARLDRRTLALFSAPALPLAAVGVPLSVYLPTFYSEQIGVPLAAVGLAFMLVRLIDMVFDPLIGTVMDRTRTRFGRFKPWLVVGAPILMLGIYLLFSPQRGAGPLYLWSALGVTYLGFSICQLSQVSWGSTLSGDYDERSRIYTWWQIASIVGALAVVLLPVIAQQVFQVDHGSSVRSMGLFIILLVPICVALALMFVVEPAAAVADVKASWREYLAAVRSKPARIAILVDLTSATAIAIPGALFFFFLKSVKGIGEADASLLILFYLVAALLGAPIWTWASARWGKHHALAIATAVFIATLCLVTFAIPAEFWMVALGFVAIGTTNPAPQLLLRAMVADAADEERLRSGWDNTGMLFGFITAVNKIGNALAVGIAFLFLDWSEATVGAGANHAAASWPLYVIYAGVPTILSLLTIALLARYPLTPARHREIRMRLEERRLATGSVA